MVPRRAGGGTCISAIARAERPQPVCMSHGSSCNRDTASVRQLTCSFKKILCTSILSPVREAQVEFPRDFLVGTPSGNESQESRVPAALTVRPASCGSVLDVAGSVPETGSQQFSGGMRTAPQLPYRQSRTVPQRMPASEHIPGSPRQAQAMISSGVSGIAIARSGISGSAELKANACCIASSALTSKRTASGSK